MRPAKTPLRPRRVPQRTCVGCRTVQAKRGLVRVVRTSEGRAAIDPTGKANGRGAYVHDSRDCWDAALRKQQLARALKLTLSAEDTETLRSYADSLPAATAEENG